MPPFYFVTQKLRGSSLSFPKATNIAKISSIDNFITDNETPTRNTSTRVFHDSVSNGTMTTKNIFHMQRIDLAGGLTPP